MKRTAGSEKRVIFVNTNNVQVEKSDYKRMALMEIIRTGHWMTDLAAMSLKPFDISEPQFNVLRILKGAGEPVSVNTILEKMIQRSSNITRLVDKLEAKGLVIRQLCPSDRRKMDISITEEGSRLLLKLNEVVEEGVKPVEDCLSEVEAVALYNLMIKIKRTKHE